MAIMGIAGVDAPVEPVSTTIPEGSPDRVLNGVRGRPGADAAGLARRRAWPPALEDSVRRAGLAA